MKRRLSKSKLISFRQCPKRFWLEIHRPELKEETSATQAKYAVGHQVGDIARKLYDPAGKGQLIDLQAEGFEGAFERSQELLKSSQPIFEAGFSAEGALAFADVMLPVQKGRKQAWRMIEVKSSTSVKNYHRDDAAIQTYIAQKAGVSLASIALAHIDSSWTYPGGEDYTGLLVEEDLTTEAFSRGGQVSDWIADAQKVADKRAEPEIQIGRHCSDPFECPFLEHCKGQEPHAQHPINWLPGALSKSLKALVDESGLIEMADAPDEHLNVQQRKVKAHTLSGDVYFDAENAALDLSKHKLPAYFIDFETIQFPIPIWKGTRPYQQIPFQFSVHRLSRTGKLDHQSFLDLTGADPSRAFANALIESCGETGPVFVYNAGFEKARIKELGDRHPRLKRSLLAINDRIVDLLPVAWERYYHPSQQGSWSIKAVLRAVDPDLRHDKLVGVQNGGMVMDAYLEFIHPDTTTERKETIEKQLLEYCKLDTYAMVRLWKFFTGK